MDRGTRGMAFLLACQFQAIIYLVAAWYVAEFLNEKYTRDFDWLMVTIGFALLLIIHSFYVVFRFLVKKEKKEDGKNEH